MRRFDAEFIEFVKREHAGVADAIRTTTDLSDDTSGLQTALAAFKKTFTTSDGHVLVKDVPVEAINAEDVS